MLLVDGLDCYLENKPITNASKMMRIAFAMTLLSQCEPMLTD